MRQIILVIGVPGSGKTWVCNQLQGLSPQRFEYIPHDFYIQSGGYFDAVLDAARKRDFPILVESPFGASQPKAQLEALGLDVMPVFIIEDQDVLQDRYTEREGKPIPQGHLTMQRTYAQRAEQWEAFSGTTEEVLEYLKDL